MYDEASNERYRAALVRWGKTLYPECESVTIDSRTVHTGYCETCDYTYEVYCATFYSADRRWLGEVEAEGLDTFLGMILGS